MSTPSTWTEAKHEIWTAIDGCAANTDVRIVLIETTVCWQTLEQELERNGYCRYKSMSPSGVGVIFSWISYACKRDQQVRGRPEQHRLASVSVVHNGNVDERPPSIALLLAVHPAENGRCAPSSYDGCHCADRTLIKTPGRHPPRDQPLLLSIHVIGTMRNTYNTLLVVLVRAFAVHTHPSTHPIRPIKGCARLFGACFGLKCLPPKRTNCFVRILYSNWDRHKRYRNTVLNVLGRVLKVFMFVTTKKEAILLFNKYEAY